MIKLAQDITQKKLKIKFSDSRNGDIKDSLSSINKIKKIGFSPKYDLRGEWRSILTMNWIETEVKINNMIKNKNLK